jgi:hypothetical protein
MERTGIPYGEDTFRMANTTRGIPYPDDYSDAADVPATLQSLAATVDTLIGSVDTKATNAGTSAASASTAASNAASAVASHTHNGSGSSNVAIAAVTGLSGALSGKSDTTHTHTQYAASTHTHSSAELAAHTHTEYSAAAHTHTQAQAHQSADTDTATTAIHHTLGVGANQAAPGNHVHQDYSPTSHTHNGYAASGHNHDTEYAVTTHNHNGFATTSHNHDTAYATTSHSHSSLSTLDVTGNFEASVRSSSPAFNVTSGSVYSAGINADTTDSPANVRVGIGAQLLRSTSTARLKANIAPLRPGLTDVLPTKISDQPANVSPAEVLGIVPVEFTSLSPADKGHRSFGFIAEDVAAKFVWAAEFDEEGKPSSVKDRAIIAALLYVVQEQQQAIADLTSRVTMLEEATQP